MTTALAGEVMDESDSTRKRVKDLARFVNGLRVVAREANMNRFLLRMERYLHRRQS
jgi:hypothetical protein